MTNQLF